MVQSKAKSVAEYMAGIPKEQRPIVEALRKAVRDNLDPKFTEGLQYGMLAWFLPHSVYPAGYHCNPEQPLPFVCLAAQKNYVSLYLFCVYVEGREIETFQKAWAKSGKKLDMGKSCVRFKKPEQIPFKLIGELVSKMSVDEWIALYEKNLKR